MDWIEIKGWVLAIFPAALAAGGYLVKRLANRIDEMEESVENAHKAVAAHRLHTAENYVTREALKETEARLVTHLERIEDKLDARH